MFLNEAYVGKTKRLLEMESTIDQIRKKYMTGTTDDDMGVQSYSKGIEADPLWRKLTSLLEDEFGFYSVSLQIIHGATANAWTYPIHLVPAYYPTMRKALVANKKCIKYDKSYKFCTIICVSTPLLLSKNLTSGEVLAILLHEVGHNFELATLNLAMPLRIMESMAQIYNAPKTSMTDIVELLMCFTSTGRIGYTAFRKELQKNKDLIALKDFFQAVMDVATFKYPIEIIGSVIDPFLVMMGAGTASYLIKIVQNIFGLFIAGQSSYVSEKYADSFVSLLGYGPEFASGINKANYIGAGKDNREMLATTPLFGHLLGLNMFILEHVASVFDGHPDWNTRCMTQLNVLETELKKGKLDPKARKMVEADIKEVKKKIVYFKQAKVRLNKDSEAKMNYEFLVKNKLNKLNDIFFGHWGDLRSKVLDTTYGGASSIINSLDRKANNPTSWFL